MRGFGQDREEAGGNNGNTWYDKKVILSHREEMRGHVAGVYNRTP